MLIYHRKAIVYNIIITALLIISFYVSREWGFTLRFISCLMAYYILFMPWSSEDYVGRIYRELEKKISPTVIWGVTELYEKGWHDMVNLPATIVAFGSGVLLSPCLILGAEESSADIVCWLVGFLLAGFVNTQTVGGSSFIKSKDELIKKEVDRLYLKYKNWKFIGFTDHSEKNSNHKTR